VIRSVAVFFALLLAAFNDNHGGFRPVPLGRGWTIAYSPNMPPEMTAADGTYYLDFPPQDGVHYVYRAAPAVRHGQTITMMFAIVGDGKIVPTQGDPPARVRLFLEQAGDTLSAAEEFKRWWSVESVELRAGEFTLSVPLRPDHWSSVFGKTGDVAPAQFEAAISQLGNIGFTFGGMFAGHGAYVTGGSARFVLKQYELGQ
jgi:hypothetical protein